MSSEHYTASEAPADRRALLPLLDIAFGFLVWAGHLLTVYIATAVSCVLGLGSAAPSTRTIYIIAFITVTVLFAAVVLAHARRRYRQQRDIVEMQFRMGVTVGCDAIATVAILWQTLPILLIPLCA